MDQKRIEELIPLYRDGLLEDTLPFWTRHALDRECGGFLTYLDRDGSVLSTDKPVWVLGRIIWLFSRLYNQVEPREEWLEWAKHGMDFMLRHAFDGDGRMFYSLTRDGQPLRKRRYLYTETFGVIALAEYGLAANDEAARQRAVDLYRRILMYWRTPGLLPPKVYPQTRSGKPHGMPMIMLATTQILRQLGDDAVYRDVIDRALFEVLHHFLKPELKALLETVAPDGELLSGPEGRCINPGHAIETAWFIMEEGRRRGDHTLITEAAQVLEWSLERGWDPEHGGLLYFVDVEGKPPEPYEHDMKLWWPHTEALYALLLAHHLTGEARFESWYDRVHEWTFSHFPDPEHGEWIGYLHRDGTVSSPVKGNMWKGPFHLPRMQLNAWKLLEEMEARA